MRIRPHKPPEYLRILEITGCTTETELAAYLGFSSVSSVSGALRRRQIPEEWYYRVSYRTRCRVEWLRDGELPVYVGERTVESLDEDAQRLLEIYESLSPYGRQLLLGFAPLMDWQGPTLQLVLRDLLRGAPG